MIIDFSRSPDGTTHRDAGGNWIKRKNNQWFAWASCSGGYWYTIGKQHLQKPLMQREPSPEPWTGEGLPPVGTVCEYHASYVGHHSQYARCEILAHFDGESERCAAYVTRQHDGTRIVGQGTAKAFRPIRTPEQIAAEEREAKAKEMYLSVYFAVSEEKWDQIPEATRETFRKAIDAGWQQVAP